MRRGSHVAEYERTRVIGDYTIVERWRVESGSDSGATRRLREWLKGERRR